MKLRTRIAPSPTGELHVGSLAIALKNFAWAKKNNGHFIVRIEDTDQVRKVEGAEERVLKTLKQFGIDWDEGPEVGGPHQPYFQSQRLDIYRHHADMLLEHGHAYRCFCSKDRLEQMRAEQRKSKQPPKYDRRCRNFSQAEVEEKLKQKLPFVIRLRVPDNVSLEFKDVLRGKIIFNSDEIDDQVLIKSDGFPTYHLAVVVDDSLMKINYVMRGEEWISSTPKHVLLYKMFQELASSNPVDGYDSWLTPTYAHIPVFLSPDGKGKMSKRKGTVSAQSFLNRGYLPEALLNFLMILGWTPHDQREILSLTDYVREFDPAQVSPNSVQFDVKKLDWLNGLYLRQLSLDQLKEKIKPFLPADFPTQGANQILELIHERLVRLDEVESLTDFFFREVSLDKDLLTKKADANLVAKQLEKSLTALESIDGQDWQLSRIESTIREIQSRTGWKKSQYFMMLRIAVTGKTQTPPLFETMVVLGRQKTLTRLEAASKVVEKT